MHIAHGDVLLRPISKEEYQKLIKGAEAVNHNGKYILAEGETTGHKHVLTVEKPETLTIHKLPDGRGVFRFGSQGRITHEEHEVLTTTEEFYIQEAEREYDWFEKTTRKVID